MTYVLDLLTHLAQSLAIAMVRLAPGVPYREFIIEGLQAGADEDEIVRVTYSRERKKSTLEFRVAAEDYAAVLDLPLPEVK